MPYRTVGSAREHIPSLEGLSDSQVEKFIATFNSLVEDGKSESEAIPIAIASAKKSKDKYMEKADIQQAFSEFLEKHFGPSQNISIPVIKQFQEEEMVAIEWLYPVEEEDLHGERMDLEEVRNMVASLNKANEEGRLAPNIGHVVNTDGWYLEKAWVNETDCMIGDTFVPEGWPLAKTRFTNKELWEARKSGQLTGLSIGARGRREVENVED